MIFGLVVTDKRHAAHATGLLAAAAQRGWDARCFLTDSGVCLVEDPAFLEGARLRPLSVAVCQHSLDHFVPGFDTASIKPFVVVGGQFQGAKLAQASQSLMVL